MVPFRLINYSTKERRIEFEFVIAADYNRGRLWTVPQKLKRSNMVKCDL